MRAAYCVRAGSATCLDKWCSAGPIKVSCRISAPRSFVVHIVEQDTGQMAAQSIDCLGTLPHQ